MLEQPGYPMGPKCETSSVRSISREDDLAWLAGILDGEGALGLGTRIATNNGKPYLEAKIRVYNTDVRMIQKVSFIYVSMNVVFFYNLNRKQKERYKDQLGICVTSQGSCLKILEAVTHHLANKREIATRMMDVLRYVKSQPKGGGSVARPYVGTDAFDSLMQAYEAARMRHIEPSTTTRCAGEALVLPDDIV
jgi:hypothetical protein